MRNFKEFIDEALSGNGVQNDSQNIWVEVDGESYTISINSVMGTQEEKEPFEASYALENDLDYPAWEEFYDLYKEEKKE